MVNHALMVFWFVTNLSEAVIVIILLFVPLEISLLVFLSDIFSDHSAQGLISSKGNNYV